MIAEFPSFDQKEVVAKGENIEAQPEKVLKDVFENRNLYLRGLNTAAKVLCRCQIGLEHHGRPADFLGIIQEAQQYIEELLDQNIDISSETLDFLVHKSGQISQAMVNTTNTKKSSVGMLLKTIGEVDNSRRRYCLFLHSLNDKLINFKKSVGGFLTRDSTKIHTMQRRLQPILNEVYDFQTALDISEETVLCLKNSQDAVPNSNLA